MSARSFPRSQITGLVLAGGRATRMGGVDKGLVELQQRPMIEWVLERLRPQVANVVINANRHFAQYQRFGHTVLPDDFPGFLGPLAGVAAGLRTTDSNFVAIVPCDAPDLPLNLVSRLHQALIRDDADLSVAHDGERPQSVFMLLKRELLTDLLEYLDSGERRVDRWHARHRIAVASFADQPHAFVNINDIDTQRVFENRLTELTNFSR